MSINSEFSDYAPVSRSKGRKVVTYSGDEEDFRNQPFRDTTVGVAGEPSVQLPSSSRRETQLPPDKPSAASETDDTKSLFLKRGHTLSFVGLVLFTLVLYVRPYEFFPNAPWLQNIAFFLAIATLAIFVPTQLGLEGKLTIRPREVNLILLLLIVALLSVPLALDPLLAWNGFIDYLKVVLMFIVLVNVVRSEHRLKLLFLLVFVVSCALSIAALNDYLAGRLELGGQRIKGMIGGMFDNPNDLALHLVTIIPIAISLLFSSKAVLKKSFYGVVAILLTAGVVVTFSRGGFLGLICMGSVLAWRIGRRNKWIVVMLVPLVLAAFIIFAPGGYGSRLSTTNDESALARTDELKRSVYLSLRHPLLGVGLGNFVLFSNSNHATHNSYTQVSSEMGLAALLLYVLFQIVPLKELRRIARETSDARRKSHYYYLSVGLEASIIGFMVTSFFASVALLWYVYFLVGYAVCIRRLYDASGEHPVLS